jgi:ankyrin repeat protein
VLSITSSENVLRIAIWAHARELWRVWGLEALLPVGTLAVIAAAWALMVHGDVWGREICGLPTGNVLLLNSAWAGDLDGAEQALSDGASPNCVDDLGMTAVVCAAASENPSVIELLVHCGADIRRIADNGLTPLAESVVCGRVETARFLLDHGADANQRLPRFRSALYVAVELGREQFVRLLLEHGANPNLGGSAGQSPLMIASAADYGNRRITALLLAAIARSADGPGN